MSKLDPVVLFRALCADIPERLRRDVFVTGSLAAAYAFRVKLQNQAVNTKDADLLVHPAGNVGSAARMAEGLLGDGWRRTEQCVPLAKRPRDLGELRAIRLMPPGSNEYFIEFLNVPGEGQTLGKVWIPVKVGGVWYGMPSFKFMGLLAWFRRRSEEGLEYAAPDMMALSNMLAHQALDEARIESGEFLGIRRCAKDLGRVMALAHLAGRGETEAWAERWQEGLENAFPRTWRKHAKRAGAGLREMMADDGVMEEARKTTESGLLSGMGMGVEALRAVGARLLADAVEPLEGRVSGRGS